MGVPGKQDQPAGLVIQPVAGHGRFGLRLLTVHISLRQLRQADAAPGVRLHADAGALVDEQHVRVLVHHVEGLLLYLHAVHENLLPRRDADIGPDALSVQLHVPPGEGLPHRLRGQLW